MTKPDLDQLARDLTADPPRPVDSAALAAVDRDDLAAALRRNVAGLDPAEQRTRLAAAFARIAGEDTEAPGAEPSDAASAARQPILTPAWLVAAVAVVLVAAAGGVWLGARTETTPTTELAVGGPVDPVPVVHPIAIGEPPSAKLLRGLLPPDPEAHAARQQRAAQQHPDAHAPSPTAPGTTTAPSDDASDGATDGDTGATGAEADRSGVDRPGLADGSRVFGGDDPAQGDTSGAPAADGVVDLCASDAPPAGCDGVGATVQAYTHAFSLTAPPEAWNTDPCETDDTALPADTFVFTLYSTNLGDFAVRYRVAGSDDGFRETTGTSPEIWRDALAEGYPQVMTCVVAERPSDAAAELEVQVDGVGVDDSGADSFVGTVELPAAAAPPVAERRVGRPDVRVEGVTASTLQVTVPVRVDEQAEVTLVPRDPAAEVDACAADDPADAVTATRTDGTVRLTDTGEEPELRLNGWGDWTFQVEAPGPGAYAVCVNWFDNAEPPANLERASVPVQVQTSAVAQVVAKGYLQAPGTTQPDPIEVRVNLPDGDHCGSTRYEGGVAGRNWGSEEELCTYGGAPGVLGVAISSHFGDQVQTQRALLAVDNPCETGDQCAQWYRIEVRSSDTGSLGGVLGRSIVVGTVVIGVRADDFGGESVTVGTERPVLTEPNQIEGARLVWDEVTVEQDTREPATALRVHWASDVPAEVLVAVRPLNDSTLPECPQVAAPRSELRREATVVLRGLCPGTTYNVTFDLRNGEGRTLYDYRGRPGVEDVVLRVGSGTTAALEATYSYELSFELFDEGSSRWQDVPLVPKFLRLSFPDAGSSDHSYRWSQYYNGRAYVGLDCARPSHYNRAGSNIPVTIDGSRFGPSEAYWWFDTYWPQRAFNTDDDFRYQCPSLGDQIDETPVQEYGNPDFLCRDFVIDGLEAAPGSAVVNRMLEGGTATFVGVAHCNGDRTGNRPVLRATLEITLARSRTLRGDG